MRFLEKSRGINVDTIAYDLEDSVTPGKKAEARHNLKDILSRDRSSSIKEQAVRINSVDSGYALDDLTEVVCPCDRVHSHQIHHLFLVHSLSSLMSAAQSTQLGRSCHSQGQLSLGPLLRH